MRLSSLSKYNKFILACIGAVLQVISQQYGNDHKVQLALAVLTAIGVYAVPNHSAVE